MLKYENNQFEKEKSWGDKATILIPILIHLIFVEDSLSAIYWLQKKTHKSL